MPSTVIKVILILCISAVLPDQLFAQKPITHPESFRTWAHEGPKISGPGYLTYTSRDTLKLNSSIMFEPEVMGTFRVSNVSQIRMRRSNSQGIGVLAGLVGGGLIGYFSGKGFEGDDYCGGKCAGAQPGTITALVTIGSAIVGASIGMIIGSKKRKMRINGKLTNEQYLRLQEYVIPMASNMEDDALSQRLP